MPCESVSGRDSIFRAAVNMALQAALADNKVAGVRPQQFVAGIAKDLGALVPATGYTMYIYL